MREALSRLLQTRHPTPLLTGHGPGAQGMPPQSMPPGMPPGMPPQMMGGPPPVSPPTRCVRVPFGLRRPHAVLCR